MTDHSNQNKNQLIPEGAGVMEPEGVSPVSSEGSKTIRDLSRLSQSLSLDKDDLQPQLVDLDEEQEVFIDQNQTNLSTFQNLQINDIESVKNVCDIPCDNGIDPNSTSRPHSLSLPTPLQPRPAPPINGAVNTRSRTQSDVIVIPPTRKILEKLNEAEALSKSLPQGTILRKGELIEFVADDLQEKIRRSSPMSKTGSSNSRRSSVRSVTSFSSNNSAGTSMATSTASGWSRSASSLFQQSPDDIPPIDPSAILELENQARYIADNIDLLLGNLKTSLHKMSARGVACLSAYKDSVDYTCDSVDTSIKSMYALMAKCEELNKTVEPVYQLSNQIKEIKRLLDLFESQLTDKVTKTT